MSVAQKNAITILLNDVKSATTELIVNDPVYMEINLGASNLKEDVIFPEEAGDNSYLYIEMDRNSRRDLETVKNEVASIFKTYFNVNNLKLGQIISIKDLSQQILNLDGVNNFTTRRNFKDKVIIENELELAIYNPVYATQDYNFTQQDINLQFFQFPYFRNLSTISDRIEVVRQG